MHFEQMRKLDFGISVAPNLGSGDSKNIIMFICSDFSSLNFFPVKMLDCFASTETIWLACADFRKDTGGKLNIQNMCFLPPKKH